MQTMYGHEWPDSAELKIFLLYQQLLNFVTSSLLPAPHGRVNSLSIFTAVGLSVVCRTHNWNVIRISTASEDI